MAPRILRAIVPLLLFIPLTSLAEVFKEGSTTRVPGSTITIRWETLDESLVKKFVVYRREYQSGGWGPSDRVGEIEARRTNNSAYQIADQGIFKTTDRMLEYEIRAVDPQGVVIETTKMTTVFSNGLTSAARRTWGSIKAMFR